MRVDREVGQLDDQRLFAMFGAALDLMPPWQVTSVAFDKEAGKRSLPEIHTI